MDAIAQLWKESDRLDAIESYGILDTPREDDYDEIAKLAAQICGAPISAVAFVLKEKQWFKAEVGLGIRETSLEASFCKHAILQKEPFVIQDAAKDPRFRSNPLVTGKPHVRFYAGIPLETPEGIPIGALCVLDYKPRTLTEKETLSLTALARLAMIHLELRRALIHRSESDHRLRVSELSYRRLFEAAKDGIFILDADTGCITDVNPFLCEFLGFSRDHMLGKTIGELSPFRDIEANEAMLLRLQNNGYVRYEDLPLKANDGRNMAVECVCNVYWVSDKRVIQCNIRDITERKRTEARFRRLVDSNAQGIIFWNTKGEITGANDAFLHMVGFSREELEAGKLNWATMTPPEYAERDLLYVQKLSEGGGSKPYEKEYIHKNGSRVPVLIGAVFFEDSPKEGVCFVVDLTERKQLEQQFLRAQRMESIGTLAGGIAHDLNNVLAPITMSIELLKMRFPDRESQELLATLKSSAQRGADMVRQVLSFARGVEGRKMDVQVKHILQDIEKIATDTFPKNIQVRSLIANDLGTILGDPTQLHQVLLNLCVNARDAMPSGGILTISAENVHVDEHYAGLNVDAHPGAYVVLQITDTGTGMPPGVIEKIFDPFFTTKELGKGTGLGLSTSLAIVKSHGGFIRVYSEMGKGTTFKAYLPAQTRPADEAGAEIAAELPRGNGELILVVDDEASVREITRKTLEGFGYRVVVASDGAEAVADVARLGAEIAVVLTDMMMPVMDGPATIKVLLKLNPDLPMIAASGLTADGRITQAEGLGVRHFLSKPYSADALLLALRQILSAK